jgi:FAD:protein FMN transferase
MTITAPAEPDLRPDTKGVRRLKFRALGTACLIQYRLANEEAAHHFAAEALGWLGAFEAKFSRFRADSMVSRINAAAGSGWVETDAEMERMLDIAAGLFFLTGGVMDPTMLPLLRVWDWKQVHEKLPSPEAVEEARALTGWANVQRRKGAVSLPRAGMGLDFGGFGKEFAVDQLTAIAKRHGIRDALIDLGRDIMALGGNGAHPFWHVGIEDGMQPGQCRGGLGITNRAVAASGDYARHFVHNGVRYGHILDPRTGWPVGNEMRAVTVVAPTCLEAGVYSTTVFILGGKEGMNFAARSPHVAVSAQTDRGVLDTREFVRWQVQAA